MKIPFQNIFEIIAKYGNNAENLLDLAAESFANNNLYKARFYLESLIKEYPAKAEYFSAMGTIYKKLENLEEAKKWYLKAIQLEPDCYEAHYNLGLVYCQLGETQSEIDCYLKTIQYNPELALAYYNAGNAYRKLEQFGDAEIFYKEAIRVKNNFDDAYFNLGVVCERSGKYLDGLDYYKKTIEINPGHEQALWNKALLNLKLENFEVGWQEYELRKTLKSVNTKKLKNKLLKNQDVSGKRVLVYSEQGLGDNIQFLRFLKKLKDKNAFVIFECNPKLYHLFKGHKYIDELILQTELKEPQIKYDYQTALLSLPKYFDIKLETIPNETPYLFVKPDDIKKWEEIISCHGVMKIGIAWSGASNNLYGKNRSCKLDDLLPLFSINDVEYFSLQKDDEDNVIDYKGLPVTSFKNIDETPFIDTSAIIKNLDLVISIDTSIAHLAGALGIETWVMLSYHSDWRWFLNRGDSPWYPNMKLFRQQINNSWETTIEQIKEKLEYKLLLKNFPHNFNLN